MNRAKFRIPNSLTIITPCSCSTGIKTTSCHPFLTFTAKCILCRLQNIFLTESCSRIYTRNCSMVTPIFGLQEVMQLCLQTETFPLQLQCALKTPLDRFAENL